MRGSMVPPKRSDEEEKIQREILSAIKNIRYGSVEIIIHDSKVVQIERKEKVRFSDSIGKTNPSE